MVLVGVDDVVVILVGIVCCCYRYCCVCWYGVVVSAIASVTLVINCEV